MRRPVVAKSNVPSRTPLPSENRFPIVLLIYFLSTLLLLAPSYGQLTKTGAVDEKAQEISEEIAVWAVPAEQKVRPNHHTEETNVIWSKAEKKISVAGAINEHIPFQVVISTPVPKGRRPKAMDGLFIETSDLRSEGGDIISQDQIKCFLQHYIMLYAQSSPVGATGYWPDALVPIEIPFSMDAQYAVVKNRPIWIDVYTPANTRAGMYTGTIKISHHGEIVDILQLQLEVYRFTLPEKTDLITYMNVSKGQLARFYNLSSHSWEIDQLTQTYYEFLYEHRMEPWFNDQLEPEIVLHDANIEVAFNAPRYHYYMDNLKTKRVLLEAFPSGLRNLIKSEKFSSTFNQKVVDYLSQVEAYFTAHGWKERLVFNSPIDEPNTKLDFEETRQWAQLVHEATNEVPFLSTKTPLPSKSHPDWGTLRGHVDHFSIHGNHLNNPEIKQAIIDEQAKGGEMTWYISCDQVYPQPNYFIDAPAMDLVMVPWITDRYQMDGILYWACNFWSQTPNPWLDAVTFISGFVCSDGHVLNGEGSLLYPGDFAQTYTGQPNVDGPVSSIRFELLREGIEDHVYLSMLKESGDREFANATINNMVVDVRAFSRNVVDLYSARKAMARRLEN